jgi:hypothetical protein
MRQRLLAFTIALVATIATAAPAVAGVIRDPNRYGEWIADVERPAGDYRGR